MSHHEVTSGELLYRLNQLQTLDLLPDQAASSGLRSFLEVTGKDQTRKRDMIVGKVLNIRPLIEKTYQAQMSHVKFMESFLISQQRAVSAEVQKEADSLRSLLHNNSKTFDTNALQSTLEYFSVLKKDIEGATEQLRVERSEKDSLKKQAKVCRDILLFSAHLKLETNRKVEITALPVDSAQFTRCVRAVHDNLGATFGMQFKPRGKLSAQDVRILNVFKLKNDIMTKTLTKHSSKIKSAKLRGMFCCIPPENVYGFSVYGIHEQALPEKLQERAEKDKSVFSTPWLFASSQPLRPLNEELQDVHNIAGAARKLALRSTERPVIRFSKFSTISSISNYSPKQLEKGVLLALCRVLIVKQQTISTMIEDSDIVEAASQGYDALYSSYTEEYVLLQPGYVVPEFLIHTFFSPLIHSAEGASPQLDNVELPSSLVTDPNKTTIPAKWRGKMIDVYGDNGVAPETVMLRNNFLKLESAEAATEEDYTGNSQSPSRSPNGKTLPSSPQRNVIVKQTSLNNIEKAVQEFRSLKSLLFQEKAEQLQRLMKPAHEKEVDGRD